MHPRKAAPAAEAAIKHTTRVARALVKDIQYGIELNTPHRDQETEKLGLNEIDRVQVRTRSRCCATLLQEPHHRGPLSSSTRPPASPSVRA
jgi:sulfate adenylyltransferase subunit 1 (EFTu-like GTPase family)